MRTKFCVLFFLTVFGESEFYKMKTVITRSMKLSTKPVHRDRIKKETRCGCPNSQLTD